MAVPEYHQDTLKERATELFSLCDQEGKGFITQHDLVGVINELGLPLDSAQVKQAFTKLDDDENGFLTLDEFTAGFGLFLGLDGSNENGELEELATSDPGRELFYLCDSDRKGYITKPDLQRVASDLSLNFDQLDLIFDKLDQDGNGKLTLDEFADGFGKFLSGTPMSEDDEVDYGEHENGEDYEQGNDVFENISSRDGSNIHTDDAFFNEVLETVGEDILAGGNLPRDQLRDLWDSLQQGDARSIQKFQDFLTKVSSEIRRSRTESEQLETALKSKINSHDTEVQRLYEEMESQIKTVKEGYQMEQQKREKQIKTELLDELEKKEAEIHWMLNKQKKLEELIQRKEKGEQEVKSENEKLLEKNWYLEEQLNDSVSSLEDTRSYVHQLQAMTAEEKKERARAAMRVTEGMQKEQQSLVEQLDMLREINQKLRDDRDAIEAAHQAKRERGSSLSDELEEAESKHKKVSRQGSKMSKYFDKKQRRTPTSPVSPRWGQQGSFESITEEGESGSEGREHRDSVGRKHRRKSSKRSRRMKKQGSVLAEYYNTSGEANEGIVTGSTSSDVTAMDLSALSREVEFEGEAELAKIMVEKPQQPVWAKKIMAAYDEAEKAKKEKEAEEFRQRKADLMSGRSSDEERSLNSDDAFYTSSEFESDSSRPRSPRAAPVGKDDDPSLVMESSTLLTSPQLTNPERVFKVVFIGDSGVGKSSFIHRFCHDQWKPSFTATIGVDFQIKTMIVKGQCIAIQLWDTAGQERFRSITKQYFRKADGILIFYDVTAESSFINLKSWMLSVEEGAEEGSALMVLCNKTDLVEHEEDRVVTTLNGKNLANQYNALYMETSAKTGDGIQEAMTKLAEVLQAREDQMMQSVLHLANTPNTKKKKCCKSS